MSDKTPIENWCWTEQEDAERWHAAGPARDFAIAMAKVARQEDPNSQPDGFWIAPMRPVAAEEIGAIVDDHEIEAGDMVVDLERAEYFPPDERSDC